MSIAKIPRVWEDWPMKRHFKRTMIFTAGVVCIPLGIAGLVLPFLQGIILLIVGMILLSIASPAVRTWTERHTRRWPRFHSFVERIEKRITDVIGLP